MAKPIINRALAYPRSFVQLTRNITRGHRELSTHGITHQNFWNISDASKSWLYLFLQRENIRPLSRKRKIAIYSVFGPGFLRRFISADKNIFITGENLHAYRPYEDHALDWADLSLGFDYLNSSNYLRFPIWLLMCFPPQAKHADIEAIITHWNKPSPATAKRKGFASLIARHDKNGIRSIIGDIAESIKPVNYPGNFRNNTSKKLASGWPAKIDYLKDFQFNICPENSDRKGYVTEKLFQAIEAGCIPIYWGSGNTPEPGIINPNKVLFFKPDTPQELSRRIHELITDPATMDHFLHQPAFLPEASSEIYAFYQQLEDQLIHILT